MAAEPTVPQTEAERALAALFEMRSAHFTEAPLDAHRAEAFEKFAAAGLPHRRVEQYRYTDLKAKLRRLPEPAGEASLEEIDAILAGVEPLTDGARLVIANGRFVPERSDALDGVTIASLLDPNADTSAVGALSTFSSDPLTLANLGLFDGGAVIRVETSPARPLEIVHVITDDAMVMGRLAVFVPADQRLSVVERAVGAKAPFTNDLTELTVDERARVDWVRLVDGRSADAVALATLRTILKESAQLESLVVSTGEGLSRVQAFAHIAGDDAEANFRAATVAVGKRHADNTLVVRHDALASRSSEVFRSAVGQHGTAIIQGQIIVDPGAQKTDAKMMSNALFLDDTGEVVNKPELEIFADDVVCGHGATSGDLDEEMVFYLRARGVPERIARRLLVEAFLVEALDRVEDEPLQEALATMVRHALDREEGL